MERGHRRGARRRGATTQAQHLGSGLMWFNTAVLLVSSGTLEMARKRLGLLDVAGFRRLWAVTTILGVVFLIGQVVAWRQLLGEGIYLASNPASSFFYIFTGAHALHLLGGVGALLYVARRNFERAQVTSAFVFGEVGGWPRAATCCHPHYLLPPGPGS